MIDEIISFGSAFDTFLSHKHHTWWYRDGYCNSELGNKSIFNGNYKRSFKENNDKTKSEAETAENKFDKDYDL